MIDTNPVRAFLDDDHVELAPRLTAYADEHVAPLPEPDDDDRARVQARELLDQLGRAGWFEPIADQDLRACCLVRETLGAASPLADAVFALQALGITPLLLFGNEAMRDVWLQPAVAGAAMGAFAITEPEAGSDVGSLQTTATRQGDAYVLDGTKWLISNAGVADFYVTFARTDPEAGSRGISCFVVPAATPGLTYVAPQVMSAAHPLGEIAFEGCRVPAECLLGEEGSGFKIAMATLDRLRPTVGAAACGMATRALDEALSHATTRSQFGKKLAELQLVQAKLADMATELTAARLLVYRAAWEKDGGADRISLEAAMAKAYATEAAQRIVDAAVQIVGGRGVLQAHPVDRLYRSVRALRIYEGATEIQHLIIAGHLVRERDAG